MEQPRTKAIVTITEMAGMVGLSPARFRQLMGSTFPSPLYSVATRRPFYPEDMPPKPYDPFDPGVFVDFAGTEDFRRFLIGNWKVGLWWAGSKWVEDRSKSKLFSDFVEARDEAWHIRIKCLRFPEQ